MTARDVDLVMTAHRQREGAGFVVRRPLPTRGLPDLDPFLLIDEMGPVDYAPEEAVGAPDHPHRGFEAVTYILEGEGEHEDSAGNRGVLRAGDVQWMTAGRGVVHSEMPSRRIQAEGGRVHGFQIWVNLPAADKMVEPRYQEVPSSAIPKAQSEDGRASVVVVAGEALGVEAAIETHTPIWYQDWTLHPGAEVELPVPEGFTLAAYVFAGRARVGSPGRGLRDGQLARFGAGDRVVLRGADDGDEPARVLLLGGRPLGEPIARHGPFVMNTEAQIHEAIDDYQAGRMGRIPRR